jgi:nucleotide-binding universal stress UspA family protein
MFENVDDREKIFEALQHLRYNKHEVIVFHVTDHNTEIDFNFENRPYLFVDVETGAELKLHANTVKDEYVIKMKTYMQEIQNHCQQEKIDVILANAEKGFNEVLNSYLVKRMKMH